MVLIQGDVSQPDASVQNSTYTGELSPHKTQTLYTQLAIVGIGYVRDLRRCLDLSDKGCTAMTVA